MAVNWNGDINPFHMEQPPEWWLQGLYDFDHQLVIIPSQMKAQYLLTRRRSLTQVSEDVILHENKSLDTTFCVRHRLIPIAPLKWKTGAGRTFTQLNLDSLLSNLRARDSWALTKATATEDPDAAWKAVEAQERAVEKMERSALRDKFYHMGRDAYRSMKARTGQRNKRASDYHGVAATPQPQAEQRVVLTDAQ